jgi:two-component system sensor histidine kinase BaeS
MRTLRGRLILSHILPLLLVLPLVAIGLVYILETQVLLTNLTEDLTDRATIIAEAIESSPDLLSDAEDVQRFVSSISLNMDGQIIILKPNGDIIAASHPDYGDLTGQTIIMERIEVGSDGEPSVSVQYNFFQQGAEVYIPVVGADQQLQFIVGVTQSLEGVTTEFDLLRKWVLLILFLELALAFVIGYVLALRLSRPISHVSNAIIDIADGERIEPLKPQGPQEIQRLSSAVNILSERLRILEETRRRSLANIVHELGRPLGAILSAIHVLRQAPGDDPAVREELLAGAETEINRMQPLLDDLAQLHGQVTGTLELATQPTPLSDWLPPILLPWRAGALEKGLEWEAAIPSDLPTANLDPKRMAQAIGNLLSNAIKYTQEGGRVGVSAGTLKTEAWIAVIDNGPGISPDDEERIFEAFYRSRRDRRFPQGLGLGLTIARDLVEAHGGHLELVSESGEGSRFTIYLPL